MESPHTGSRKIVPETWCRFLEHVSSSLVPHFSDTTFCDQFRTCSMLLPVLVSTVSSDWPVLLLLFFVYLPVVYSLQILCCFITVATVHTALIICILPNSSHRVPWGWDHVAMTLNYLLLNLNSINETLLSVLYFSTYNCVYTDLFLSRCVVIFKIFLLRFIVWF